MKTAQVVNLNEDQNSKTQLGPMTETVRKNIRKPYQMQMGSCMRCPDAKYHFQNTSWIEKSYVGS